MNLLDLVIVVLAVSAAVGGYRLGLLARALSWAGMAVGLVLAARFLPSVVRLFDGPDPTGRLVVAAGFLLGSAFLGQALGLLVGAKAHLALPRAGRPLDRAGGAVAGLAGVAVAVWLLVPTMAEVPGSMSRLARSSAITRGVLAVAPAPPDALQALRRLVGDSQFPRVFEGLRRAPDVGPPPGESGLSEAVAAAVTRSTVHVEGRAYRRIQDGSGFVVEPGLVVTNAHVVAGVDTPELLLPGGGRATARVVLFDPDRDLALLAADLAASPLPVGQSEVGVRGAVFGHPGGGGLELSPFEIREAVEAVGRDLYDRRPTRRQVLVLAADLAPGDSGGALVEPGGTVVGVAFAIAPDRPGTAYALDTDELRTVLAAPRAEQADTGPCLR